MVFSVFALQGVLHVILHLGKKTWPKTGSGRGSYGHSDGCAVSSTPSGKRSGTYQHRNREDDSTGEAYPEEGTVLKFPGW